MAFLIDSLAEKLRGEEKDPGEPKYTDLNYKIGNTSGLDIGNVPGPLDQRIGRMSQIGGSLMEIQITNPATFQIDRTELFSVINQLGLDITFHGDPNIGFTSAYATGGQTSGYNIVHRYFKRYVEQLASFKHEIEQRQEADKMDDFEVGYVNMHASNEMIPAREERLARDVSVDPFGNLLESIDGDKDKNIFRNEEFLEKLFEYLFIPKVDEPGFIYERVFANIADEENPENEADNFKQTWDQKKDDVAQIFYEDEVEDKIGIVETAARRIDTTLERDYNDLLQQEDYGLEPFELELDTSRDPRLPESKNVQSLQDLQEINLFTSLREVSNDLRNIQQGNINFVNNPGELLRNIGQIEQALNQVMDDIWEGEEEGKERMGVQAKIQALNNVEDIQERAIFRRAARKARTEAQKTFARSSWEIREELLENLQNRVLAQEWNKESTIFFRMIPAWMQHANESYENHDGWEGPKFLWDNILRNSNTDQFNFDKWEGGKDTDGFEAFLDDRRENELNVIAAVGACYLWGHMTQNKNVYELEAFDPTHTEFDEYERPELKEGEEGEYSIIEWMNKFGLKLNIEAMFGEPGQLRRVWRPKDIAIICHAINQTAERIAEEEEWSEGYDEPIVKFTIDMEHTASYGVDPWQEVQTLEEQESEMVEEGEIDADPDKPLAKIVKTYHLTKPGWEQQSGHRHGPFARGDKTLYYWLYKLVEKGFARNPEDAARIIFEVGGEYREEMYVIRVAMDMIEMGIEPEDVDPGKIPENEEEWDIEDQLIARFFGLDQASVDREWAKIEEHAFDPLKGLLEAEEFDYTYSSNAAVDQGGNRPQEWKEEEYR